MSSLRGQVGNTEKVTFHQNSNEVRLNMRQSEERVFKTEEMVSSKAIRQNPAVVFK